MAYKFLIIEPTRFAWASTSAGPAVITALWILLAYKFMPLGPTAMFQGLSSGQQRWGDRSFLNMIEQAPLFLGALWVHAFHVSFLTATQLGFVYLGLRSLYPWIWLLRGSEAGPPYPFMFNFTFKQYGIAFYLALTAVLKIVFGFSAVKYFPEFLPNFWCHIICAWATGEAYLTYATRLVGGLQKAVFARYFRGGVGRPMGGTQYKLPGRRPGRYP
jgi:hypothetical protein